jgi:hypothetical protein
LLFPLLSTLNVTEDSEDHETFIFLFHANAVSKIKPFLQFEL